ncbi:DUF3043 domain-containing protein [Sporichthya brevicatena]|uniref:DUF3043 domain-containing protein n=1 Tax=Sporichthya brevicatena TaxID=171442 RepID=A0ABP3SA05_9ACTN
MFTRRDRESATTEAPSAPVVESGKGRPTPKRREAEKERRERIRPPRDSRERAKMQRKKRSETTRLMREALNNGDERYLPNRDKGPVRKFCRDWVDGRLTAAEFFMPIALASLVLMVAGANGIGGSLSSVMILVVLVDSAILTVQLKKALKRKFPDESRRGAVSYTLMRALTWRSMRTPKPQVPRGFRPS